MKRHLFRSRWLLITLVLALLTTGCARRYVLEDLGLVISVGYDLAEDGKMLITVTMPQISIEGQERVQTITSKGDLSKEARENLSLSTDRQVVNGQLRTAIFSEKLARQGIWRSMDTILRDVNIPATLILCISDGEAREILNHKYPARPSSGRYLYELLKKEGDNYSIPATTLHEFQRQYHADGGDPIAPYIQHRGDSVYAAGAALFQGDRFVGALSPEETKLLLLLRKRGEGGDIKQTLSRQQKKGQPPDQIMLTFVNSKHRREVTLQDGKAHVHYDLKVYGQVVEYSGSKDLTKDAVVTEIEHDLNQGLTARFKDLIEQLQHRYKCDPLAVGDAIRAEGLFRPWAPETWRKVYEEAVIDVSVQTNIIRTGLIR